MTNSPELVDLLKTVRDALAPLLEALPPALAMEALVVKRPNADFLALAERASADLAPAQQVGVWLYVDDLDRAHALAQKLTTPTGAMWHAIVHRREGDFWNSRYWLRQAGRHPAFAGPNGYDPMTLVDDVEANSAVESLADRQREEWLALFSWCAREGQ